MTALLSVATLEIVHLSYR